jgi:hypothetical protein
MDLEVSNNTRFLAVKLEGVAKYPAAAAPPSPNDPPLLKKSSKSSSIDDSGAVESGWMAGLENSCVLLYSIEAFFTSSTYFE